MEQAKQEEKLEGLLEYSLGLATGVELAEGRP